MIIFAIFLLVPFAQPSTPRQRIWDWWHNQASIAKPIKCVVNPQYLQPFPMKIQEALPVKNEWKVFQSRPCKSGELSPFAFTFRGQNQDGRFEGPGKWRRFKDTKNLEDDNSRTCFDMQNDVIEAVGNFKNGALHGQGKLVFGTGEIVIGHFNNGSFGGLARRFSKNGTLLDYKYRAYKRPRGDVWEYYDDNYLLYSMSYGFYNAFEFDKDTFTDVLIPLNEQEDIYAGHYNPATEALENVSIVEIEQIVDDFCIPELKVKVVEKQDFYVSVPKGVKAYPYEKNEANCKVANDGNLSNVEEQFVAWSDDYENGMLRNFDIFKVLLQIKPSKIPFDASLVKQSFMSNVTLLPMDNGNVKVNMSIWNGPITTWNTLAIRFDGNVQFHGYCAFELEKAYWNMTAHDFAPSWSPKHVLGMFHHGKLQGYGMIVTWKEQVMVASFRDGELHGLANVFGTASILDAERKGAIIRNLPEGPISGCGFLGQFKNGQVHGNFWVQMHQGGWLHGQADQDGSLSGDDIAHIYPDGQTALKGRFENGYMRHAFNVDVEEYGCDDNGMLTVTKFSEPISDTVFRFDPPTNTSFGFTDAPDPYEVKNVKLATSSVPNSGEGVVLIKDLPYGRIACYYSLYAYYAGDETRLWKENFLNNKNKSDEYRRECKKYSLGLFSYHIYIEIPPEFDVNPLPNLGPKVNHDFARNNSVYSETEHPVWGMIQTVTTRKDMKAGEELFTYYGYERDNENNEPKPFPEDFPWYYQELNRIEELKKMSKKSKKKKASKKKNGSAFA